jgi:DNA gyrase/topoisomerase IV subunit B
MAENKEGFDEHLEKLALISEAIDEIHAGKKAVVFQLKNEEFLKVRDSLSGVPTDKTEFKIDISGIEFIYLLDES